MKALTLHQPWATLIAIGAKQIETRSWAASYHGWLAIHASKVFPAYGKEAARHPLFMRHLRENRAGQFHDNEVIAGLPLGAIVALANLHCVRRIDHWQNGEIHVHGKEWAVGEAELAFGDYTPGRFGWVLSNVARLTEPIPCRGAQGLWDVPAEIEAKVWEQLGVVK